MKKVEGGKAKVENAENAFTTSELFHAVCDERDQVALARILQRACEVREDYYHASEYRDLVKRLTQGL